MTTSTAPSILVAGMGPVGLTAALSLARKGYEVTVLEEGGDLSTESRASTFHPPSLEVLDDLGVADELIAMGLKAPGFQYRGHSRELIAHLDMSVLAEDTRFPFRVQCEQSKLTRIIRRHLERMPNVTLRFDSPVERVELGSDCARVFLPGDGFEPSYTVDWLLGADGANSAVRRSLGIAFEGVTYPERFLVASTTHDFAEDIEDLAPVTYVYDPDDWGVLLRTPTHWRVLFPIADAMSAEDALDPDHLQKRLQSVVPLDEPYPVVHATIYAVHQRVAATFGLGRVLLLGDAAHINNPLGGMGMNSGIHDACAAVAAVEYAVAGGDAERAVRTYATVRRDAAVLDVQTNTHKNYEEMRQQDAAKRDERRREMAEIAADPERLHAYLRVTSMLASFHTSQRRMRRGLSPVAPAPEAPAGRELSDQLREWALPGTPKDLLTAEVIGALPETSDALLEITARTERPVVVPVPAGTDVAEAVRRVERGDGAAVELRDASQVRAAVAARRDLLVIATVDATGREADQIIPDVRAMVDAGADVVTLDGTTDADLTRKVHLAAPEVPLALIGSQLPSRLAMTLAGVGLVLRRAATPVA